MVEHSRSGRDRTQSRSELQAPDQNLHTEKSIREQSEHEHDEGKSDDPRIEAPHLIIAEARQKIVHDRAEQDGRQYGKTSETMRSLQEWMALFFAQHQNGA